MSTDKFNEAVAERRQRVTEEKHPPGFEPGLEYNETGGTGITARITAQPLLFGPEKPRPAQ